ncbi:MAG: hypothetical protein Q9183_008057, partial [Haloplaca sp. 2 TL-2023]
IIYTSTSLAHASASKILHKGIETLLDTVRVEHPEAEILCTMNYTQKYHPTDPASAVGAADESTLRSGILRLQDLGPSLALEDDVLRDVRRAWNVITADEGDARGSFIVFGEREGMGEDEGVQED